MIQRIETHIEKMRGKPMHVKKQYSFLVSLAITLVIFGFWSLSFRVQAEPMAQASIKVPSPASSLTASVGDAVGSVGKNVGGIFIYVKELFFGANKTVYSSDNVEVVGGRN